MTPAEFAARAMAVPAIPWRKWHSSWEACDCFGLIVLYFREVLGVSLGDVPQTDIATGFLQSHGWEECEPQAGATCFMAWRDGSPTHCGVLLDASRVIHAEGSEDRHGSVRVTRISAMRRIYGELKFYRYSQC